MVKTIYYCRFKKLRWQGDIKDTIKGITSGYLERVTIVGKEVYVYGRKFIVEDKRGDLFIVDERDLFEESDVL